MSALADELTAACAAALARHQDPRLDEVLERLARIEASLPPTLRSISETARLTGLSVPTIKRRVRAGDLPTIRVGSRTLIDVSKLHGLDGVEIARLAAQVR